MYRGIGGTCISFAEAGQIRLLLVSKLNVGLKSILHQSLSERKFYVEIKKIMDRTVFSDQSRKQLRHKRIGYDLNGKLEILLLRFFVTCFWCKEFR